MHKRRFFVPDDLSVNIAYEFAEDLAHQIVRVLRLRVGAQIFLFNNSGYEYAAAITNIARNSVTVQIIQTTADNCESPCQIHLAQVIGKGEKMEWVIQKATELGVTSITPLLSQYSVAKTSRERMPNKIDHWKKVAVAASCQAGRNLVPMINPIQEFADFVTNAITLPAATKLLLSPSDVAIKLRDHNNQNLCISPINISIVIGPEGGFSDTEIAQAQSHGFTIVSLGPRILRTETAGIAALAILQSIYGDL